jgi:hypothetical protein
MIKQLFFYAILLSAVTSVAQTDSSKTEVSKPEYEASIYYYSYPHEPDIITPVFYADINSIHLEGRFNYEDKNTASVFAGYRFETGGKIETGITPVAGIVFGNTNGFAPGLLLDLTYGKFDFYSESELLIDFESLENNYIYTWSELAFSPNDAIRFGLSANRTRLYENDKVLQHGLFAEYSFSSFTAGLHYFNPLTEDYFLIGKLSYSF